MYCVHCGKQIRKEMHFCPYCGTKQSGSKETLSEHLETKDRQDKTDGRGPELKSRIAFICVVILFLILLLCIFAPSLTIRGNSSGRGNTAPAAATYAPVTTFKPPASTALPTATAVPDHTINLADLEGNWWCKETNEFISIFNLSYDGTKASCFYAPTSGDALRRGFVLPEDRNLLFYTSYNHYYPDTGLVRERDDFLMQDVRLSVNSFSVSAYNNSERRIYIRQSLKDTDQFSGIWYMESDPVNLLKIAPSGAAYAYTEDSPDEYDFFAITFYTDIIMTIEPGNQEYTELATYTSGDNWMRIEDTTEDITLIRKR